MRSRGRQKDANKNAHILLEKKYGVVCEFEDDGFFQPIFESNSRADCRKYIRRIYKVNPFAVLIDKGRRLELRDIGVFYYIIGV